MREREIYIERGREREGDTSVCATERLSESVLMQIFGGILMSCDV